jgi:hypothetical protein
VRRNAKLKKLADIRLEFVCHPEIHAEDARNAILAWFRRTYKDRRKPPHIILEKALIAAAIKEGRKVSPAVWRDHKGKVLAVPPDGFETRYKRARKDGRAPMWDKIDDFILRNWRVMRPLGEFRWELNVPGLIEWSPRATTALIRALPLGEEIGAEKNDETWYVQKRNRLGLQGKRRYRVHGFGVYKDGLARIDID